MHNRIIVFAALFSGIFTFGLGITMLGAVAPWLNMRFVFENLETGILFSILPIGILLGSLFFGNICDRYGYKSLLIGCCLLMAAGFLGIAIAWSSNILKASIFLFGVGGGGMNGATSAAVSDMSEKSKAGNLSLLGLFFGIGTLGMPFLFALLNDVFSYSQIIAGFGWLALALAVLFTFISFPPAKPMEAISRAKVFTLIKDPFILLVAFFLFCQSSFESIMNNWTTTYLIKVRLIENYSSLYGLSLLLIGYTITRLLLGTIFSRVPVRILVFVSIFLCITGTFLLSIPANVVITKLSLFILGAGLSGGFPLMLGLVGARYKDLSGTAFSVVLVIALMGNMLINYFVGKIAKHSGISHLTDVAFVECVVMLLIALLIFRRKSHRLINN